MLLQDIDKFGIRSKRKPHNDEKQFPEQWEGNFVGWSALNHPAVPFSITYLGGEESVPFPSRRPGQGLDRPFCPRNVWAVPSSRRTFSDPGIRSKSS